MAVADSRRDEVRAATTSPFKIVVRFLGGLSSSQEKAFTAAADRWVRVMVGDLPSVVVDGEVIDDLLILAQGRPIDGPGGILGQAGPTHVRPHWLATRPSSPPGALCRSTRPTWSRWSGMAR
ncbi:hypothetical protein ACIPSA_30270 [Streptomyces sp. NPDC086549]|uniref:hypothetical protein n=1 Tax=Streptomyces sp. NPDC086549 TaxID=3365752 RepID=UPI0038061216